MLVWNTCETETVQRLGTIAEDEWASIWLIWCDPRHPSTLGTVWDLALSQ